MVMLKGYAHLVDFFLSFEWWKTEPHGELVNNGAYCLAQPGEIYAVYLPNGGEVAIRPAPGRYEGKWFNAFTGETAPAHEDRRAGVEIATHPRWLNWALLLTRKTK